MDGDLNQLILHEQPWDRQVQGISASRLAPRPDWAPPSQLPMGVHQAFVAPSSDGSAWAVTFVTGGDGCGDGSATWVSDAGGPLISDADSPLFSGARGSRVDWATQHAVCLALTMAEGMTSAPLILRVPLAQAQAVAGMHPLEPQTEAVCQLGELGEFFCENLTA